MEGKACSVASHVEHEFKCCKVMVGRLEQIYVLFSCIILAVEKAIAIAKV